MIEACLYANMAGMWGQLAVVLRCQDQHIMEHVARLVAATAASLCIAYNVM